MKNYGRILWIVTTFFDYGDMCFEELNERWLKSSFCDNARRMSTRSFARDREAILLNLHIDIEYNFRIGKYQLKNSEMLTHNQIYKYLLGIFHIKGLTELALEHKERVMLDNIPTGTEFLHLILDAIARKKTVKFSYHSYFCPEETFHYEVIPCFIRLFEQRWYLICEYLDRSASRVLALERMKNPQIGNLEIASSPTLNPQDYYASSFGIIRDEQDPQKILMKVFGHERDYIDSVPLHSSQQKLKEYPEYTVYSYFLKPTYDFIQRLLWHRDRVEVMSPIELRHELRDLLKKMAAAYL